MIWTRNKDRGADSIPTGEEFSASVWDQCQPSVVNNLGSYVFLGVILIQSRKRLEDNVITTSHANTGWRIIHLGFTNKWTLGP